MPQWTAGHNVDVVSESENIPVVSITEWVVVVRMLLVEEMVAVIVLS